MKFKKGDRVAILQNDNLIAPGLVGKVMVEMDKDGHYAVLVPSKKDWFFFSENELAADTSLHRFLAGLDTKQDKK